MSYNIDFEWDDEKNRFNQKNHNVSFELAQYVFDDPLHIVTDDDEHSDDEDRYYCFGKVQGEILTVCFTYRNDRIRIISAGYWIRGKHTYEQYHSNLYR